MKDLLFEDWKQWRVCFWSGVCKMAWGVYRIVSCIIFGVVSVFWWIGKQINAFCSRETLAAVIIGIMISLLCLGWILTFVNERAARVHAEDERDSISYVLKRYTVAETETKVVVDGDTIKVW